MQAIPPLDLVLYVAFPYTAIILAIVVGVARYRNNRFTYSSLSSQFLENRELFWGSVPWHYGIIAILTAHLLALLLPTLWVGLLADPLRLYVLEITGLALAVMALVGLALLLARRLSNQRALTVTSAMDWVLLVDLLVQVGLGIAVAVFYRWGSDWYLQTAVPWLISLATLNPQVQYVTVLPWLPQLHILNGVLLFAIFPFTRLVHFVTFPITYLWRPYQVTLWNNRPRTG